jgi:hypothetical protein
MNSSAALPTQPRDTGRSLRAQQKKTQGHPQIPADLPGPGATTAPMIAVARFD